MTNLQDVRSSLSFHHDVDKFSLEFATVNFVQWSSKLRWIHATRKCFWWNVFQPLSCQFFLSGNEVYASRRTHAIISYAKKNVVSIQWTVGASFILFHKLVGNTCTWNVVHFFVASKIPIGKQKPQVLWVLINVFWNARQNCIFEATGNFQARSEKLVGNCRQNRLHYQKGDQQDQRSQLSPAGGCNQLLRVLPATLPAQHMSSEFALNSGLTTVVAFQNKIGRFLQVCLTGPRDNLWSAVHLAFHWLLRELNKVWQLLQKFNIKR